MHKVVILCFAGLVTSASAIVVENYNTAETAPSGLDWSYVYNYKGSSAVAVGGGWILTAKHVAGGGGSLTNGTDVYIQQEIVHHPSSDLTLVRFDNLPGYYPLYTGGLLQQTNNPRSEVLMVGYGTKGSAHDSYWTNDGTGRGTKRWGSQKIDTGVMTNRYNLTENYGFWMYFDLTDTDYEAGANPGDSGGGVFYDDGGTWKLAGIMTATAGAPQAFGTFAVSMPEYSDWVMETIPEPVTTSLVGFGTIGLFLSRAKRRRKLVGRSVSPIRREPMCDLFCTMEEGDADWADVVEHTNSLTKSKHTLQITLFSAWIEQFRSWLDGLNKVFWNHMVLVLEHGSAKVDAIKSALMNDAVRGLDAFLEKITCDKMLRTSEVRRQSIQSALKRKTIKGLDAFLDKIYWDKAVSAYETRKKAIRSAKEESFRDSYRGES